MWYLIGLIWLALVAAMLWFYGKKRKGHAVDRGRQLEALMAEFKAQAAPNPAPAAASSPPAGLRDAAVRMSNLAKKQRLLPPAETLLYYVFRTGLPDHQIFIKLTLADIIDVGPSVRGYERQQRFRKLAQHSLDLVICTKRLEVVAVVLLGDEATPDPARAEDARFAEACLEAAGIRFIQVVRANLPRHQQVRQLIYATED